MEEYINQFLNETPIEYWYVLGAFAILFIIQLYYYFTYYNRIIRHKKKTMEGSFKYSRSTPPVSVIICAQNEAENLEKFLPSILTQDYPKYEVIVVNDGSTDQSSILLEKLDKEYPHLYHTFLPMDAKYTSRKKMCLTVGIKAAKYDHLLLLDADCKPAGKFWIQSIMQNYEDGTEIVLGYSKTEGDDSFLSKLIRYDSITSAMRYLGFALQGKTYRGTAKNLSYKKNLFFQNKGFSSHLNLILGDDSLFLQEVATPQNTKVEITPQSLTISNRKETTKSFMYQRGLLLETLWKYKRSIFTSIFIENISRLLFYGVFAVLFAFFLIMQQWILAGITFLLFLIRFLTQLNIIRKSAIILEEKPFALSIPFFDILMPLISIYITITGMFDRKEDSSWR